MLELWDCQKLSRGDRKIVVDIWVLEIQTRWPNTTIDKIPHSEAEDALYAMWIARTSKTISRNNFFRATMNMRKQARLQMAKMAKKDD